MKLNPPKHPKKRDIVVDFDDTITFYENYPSLGTVRPDAPKALKIIKDAGYKIRIYTCRLNRSCYERFGKDKYLEEKERIEKFLRDNNVPFDDLVLWYEGKPYALAYIDDKNIEFSGSWKETLDKLKEKSHRDYQD